MSHQHDPWSTATAEREVLAIVRSVPAANRLLDVAGLFGGDDRVQMTFTISRGSVSGQGVEGLLRDAGVIRVEPWRRALAARDRFALALAASPKGDLHRVPAPLLLMPHGAGYNRLVGDTPGDLTVASGLAPTQLVHGGRVIPTRVALSHSEQLSRLGRTCPEAAERGVVVGDPSLDRMLAHLGRRDRYRQRLGVGHGRHLLAVSSTWSRHSLLGVRRDLLRRLLAELPLDDYRVTLIAHPNIWYRHGRAQLELWFADEIEAGLRLTPPHEGWRAAIIAADALVGDHGSVTYYAAALGRPVLLAAFGSAELDPESPLLGFGRRTRRLDPNGDLAAQIGAAVGGGAAPVTDLLVEYPGGSADRLRQVMYGLMELPLPPTPARYQPLPDPPPLGDDITAWRIEAGITERAGAVVDVTLRRFPAGAQTAPGRLLVVDAEDVAVPRWQAARAWSRRRPLPEEQAARWLARTLSEYPRAGTAVAATTAGPALLLNRDGGYLRVHSGPPPGGAFSDASVVAAVAAVWAHSGRGWRPWREGVRVSVGGERIRLTSTPPPPGLPDLHHPGA